MASTTKSEKIDKERPTTMFQGKNIHSSPVDGKLLCSFSEKTCMQRRLNHYAFCIRHVLEDKNSPFKQCKFVAKYNGQRCTNAIPVKEDRIYCNSHLQVLGLVPKKSRKKKTSEQDVHAAKHTPKSLTTEISQVHRSSQNAVSKRSEKAIGCTETTKRTPELRASRKTELLSSNPLLCQLVSTYSQANSRKRSLLPFYGVCSSDDNESEDDDNLRTKKLLKTYGAGSEVDSTTKPYKTNTRSAKIQRLREKLHAELLDVKKTISSHHKDARQSDKALSMLMKAVKSSPSLTTAAVHGEKSYLLGSRKRSVAARQGSIACTAQTPEKLRCNKTSLPYTKYCCQHILKDQKQQLFRQCGADISVTSKCLRTALDLCDKQLCWAHMTGAEVPHNPAASPAQPKITAVPLAVQKPPSKKVKRKPQARALPTPKPAKSSRRSTKKESHKSCKSDRNKKGSTPTSTKVKQEVLLNHTISHSPLFPSDHLEREQHSFIYPVNGTIKLEQLATSKNNMFDDNDSFKDGEMFDENDDSLENDDLSEDLGDISPTGMLRETVLKLPPESPDPTGSQLLVKQPSPAEAFSMNEASLHNAITSGNRVELSRKDEMCRNDVSSRMSHSNVVPGLRLARTTVITLPKYPSSTTTSHGVPLTRLVSPGLNTDYAAFKPIGPAVVKPEVGGRKLDSRSNDINHGVPFLPLSFDPLLNSPVTWGGGGKLFLNNRARPVLISGQINPVPFSPPSLSPHVSPQISLGSAFNFDRPTVLHHSNPNSPSPTLSPYSAHLPNSPHGKLVSRTLRLDSRGNPSDNNDPFFGAAFDKP